MTTIDHELYRAQNRRKTLLPTIMVMTSVFYFVMFPWVMALLLTFLTFLFAWGILSIPIDEIEKMRTIRRNR